MGLLRLSYHMDQFLGSRPGRRRRRRVTEGLVEDGILPMLHAQMPLVPICIAGGNVVRFGPLDRSNQGKVPNLRRSDTPKAISFLPLAASV